MIASRRSALYKLLLPKRSLMTSTSSSSSRRAWACRHSQARTYVQCWRYVVIMSMLQMIRYVDSTRRFKLVDGEVAFAFGKYNGAALARVASSDPDYIVRDWRAAALICSLVFR